MAGAAALQAAAMRFSRKKIRVNLVSAAWKSLHIVCDRIVIEKATHGGRRVAPRAHSRSPGLACTSNGLSGGVPSERECVTSMARSTPASCSAQLDIPRHSSALPERCEARWRIEALPGETDAENASFENIHREPRKKGEERGTEVCGRARQGVRSRGCAWRQGIQALGTRRIDACRPHAGAATASLRTLVRDSAPQLPHNTSPCCLSPVNTARALFRDCIAATSTVSCPADCG